MWARQGLLTLTPGDVIDYRFIRQQINDDSKRYSIQQIGYDPWNAELLCNQQLGQEDGFDAVEVRQAIAVMGPATAEFEKLLRWAAEARWPSDPLLDGRQLRRRQDANDNIMPNKKQSTSRIDGIVAAIIGLSRAILQPECSWGIYY